MSEINEKQIDTLDYAPDDPKDERDLSKPLKFLVVVDDTPEAEVALYFAAIRASRTNGHLTMLRVIEPDKSFQHWMSVAETMRAEAFEDAEKLMRGHAAQVQKDTGMTPEIIIREGKPRDRLLELIEEDRDIRVLVLAAGTSKEGPGPLVSALAGQMSGGLAIPITVVPGNLSHAQLDRLA